MSVIWHDNQAFINMASNMASIGSSNIARNPFAVRQYSAVQQETCGQETGGDSSSTDLKGPLSRLKTPTAVPAYSGQAAELETWVVACQVQLETVDDTAAQHPASLLYGLRHLKGTALITARAERDQLFNFDGLVAHLRSRAYGGLSATSYFKSQLASMKQTGTVASYNDKFLEVVAHLQQQGYRMDADDKYSAYVRGLKANTQAEVDRMYGLPFQRPADFAHIMAYANKVDEQFGRNLRNNSYYPIRNHHHPQPPHQPHPPRHPQPPPHTSHPGQGRW